MLRKEMWERTPLLAPSGIFWRGPEETCPSRSISHTRCPGGEHGELRISSEAMLPSLGVCLPDQRSLASRIGTWAPVVTQRWQSVLPYGPGGSPEKILS